MLFYSSFRCFFRVVCCFTVLSFFPASVEAWNFLPPALEAIQVARRLDTPLRDSSLFREEVQEAPSVRIHEEAVGDDDASVEERKKAVSAGASFGKEAFEDCIPRIDWAATLGGVPESSQRIRLARSYVVRGASEERKGAAPRILTRDSAKTTGTAVEAAAPEQEATLTALLDEANGYIASQDYVNAAKTCFQVIDTFPEQAGATDSALWLSDFAEEMLDEQVSYEEYISYFRSLPDFSACKSLKSKYEVALAHRFAGVGARAFRKATQEAEGYFTSSQRMLQELIETHPDDPFQVFITRSYMASARELGEKNARQGERYLRSLFAKEKLSASREFALRAELGLFYGEIQNRVDAALHFFEIFSAVEAGELDSVLNNEKVEPLVRLRMKFLLAYALFQFNRRPEALEAFEAIEKEFADLGGDAIQAAYYKALTTSLMHPKEPEYGVAAFENFLGEYPDTRHTPSTLVALARLYSQHEDFDSARVVLQELHKRYPKILSKEDLESDLSHFPASQSSPKLQNSTAKEAFTQQWCGPYALKGLLAACQIDKPLPELAALCQSDAEGSTMHALASAAQGMGVSLQGVRVERLEELKAPFIAFLDGQHYVLVADYDTHSVSIHSYAQPAHKLTRHAFEGRWQGEALVRQEQIPHLATRLSADQMNTLKGGFEHIGDHTDDTTYSCQNQNEQCNKCKQECCKNPDGPGDGGPPGGPGVGLATMDCDPIKGCGGDAPMQNPSDDSGCGNPPPPNRKSPYKPSVPGSPFSINPNQLMPLECNTAGVNAYLLPTQGSQQITSTDVSFPMSGALECSFKRTFHNSKGVQNYYFGAGGDVPFTMPLGNGWAHSLNSHLRVSENLYDLVYVAPSGGIFFFTRDDESKGGDVYYYINSARQSDDNFQNVVVAYNLHGEGKFTIQFTSGKTFVFSAPIYDPQKPTVGRYCRLESIQDGNQNTLTFEYNDTWFAPFGRLYRVSAPASDGRYLELAYSNVNSENGHIDTVFLKENTQTIKRVDFTYDDDPNNETFRDLQEVRYYGTTNAPIKYEYARPPVNSYLGGVCYGYYVSKITDRKNNETDFLLTYRTYLDFYIRTKDITVTYANGLVTKVDKGTTSFYIATIRNMDGDTALSRYEVDTKTTTDSTDPEYFKFCPNPNNFVDAEEWRYSYENGFLSSISAPGGKTWRSYTYTLNGRISTETNGGQTYTWVYDNPGIALYPSALIGPNGLKTIFEYDDDGRVTRYAHPSNSPNYDYAHDTPTDGDGVELEYDDEGHITSYKNALGEKWYYRYDLQGNMTHFILPDDDPYIPTHPYLYEYDAYGAVTRTTDPLGRETEYEYADEGCGSCSSGAGRQLVLVRDPDDNETTFEYDDNGNLTTVTDHANGVTQYTYDNMNRVTQVTTPGGDVHTTAYNLLGQVASTTTPDGRKTTFEYDHMGRVIKTTYCMENLQDPADDIVEQRSYDKRGNLTSVTDGNGASTSYTYDDYNRITCEQDPEGNQKHYYYDTAGRLIKVGAGSDGSIDPLEYFYNANTGRMDHMRYTNNGQSYDVYYTYDFRGHVTEVDDSAWMDPTNGAGHHFEYNSLGQMTRYRDFDDVANGSDAERRYLDHTYNAIGAPLSQTNHMQPNAHSTTYTYTNMGRLDTLTAPGNKTWDYDYNTLGQVQTVTHPNGMTTTYTYDSKRRLQKIEHKDGTTVKEGWEYIFDDAGNINRITSLAPNSQQAWEYQYDAASRLTQALRYNHAGVPQFHINYTYDNGNNLLKKEKILYTPLKSDDFTDGDYTNDPTWTVDAGTWITTGLDLAATDDATIHLPNTDPNADLWWSFKRSGPLDNLLDSWSVRLLHQDDNNYLELLWLWGYLILQEVIGGTSNALASSPAMFATENTWYDLRIQHNGDTFTLYAGQRGAALQKQFTTQSQISLATTQLHLHTHGHSPWHFDNLHITAKQHLPNNELFDDFTDGDYTQNPTWTATSGWYISVLNKQLTCPLQNTGYHHIDTPIPNSDAIYSWRYKTDNNDYLPEFYLRRTDDNNYIKIASSQVNKIEITQVTNGIATTLASLYVTTFEHWYAMQVITQGPRITLWRGDTFHTMTQLCDINTATHLSGNSIRFTCWTSNDAGEKDDILFDDIHITNLVPPATSFSDDFDDGDYTGWTGDTSRWTITNGAMCKPTNTNTSIITHTNPHRDAQLQFTYTLDPTSSAANPALVAMPHYINWSNQLQIRFYKDNLQILQYKDGTLSTLANNNNAPSTLNQTYDATILLDGNHIEIWRAPTGQPQQPILQTDTLAIPRGAVLRFMTLPSTTANIDNIQFTLPQAQRTTYAYNKANELRYSHTTGQPPIAYTYDNHGRLTQKSQQTHDGSYQTNYTWLFGDKLKHITSTFPGEHPDTHYLYDGLGRRRNKVHNASQPDQTITWYRYNASWGLLSQHNQGTDPNTLWDIGDAEKMWYNGVELTGSDPTTATWTYPMRDHLGTPRAAYGHDKTLTSRNEYSPYGIPEMSLGAPSPIGYTGHYHDTESNLNYAPYRYYNPQNARWLKRDPVGMIDGINVYSYVLANPTNQYDKMGLFLMPPGAWVPIPPNYRPRKPKTPINDECDDCRKEAQKIANEINRNTRWEPGVERDNDNHMKHCVASCRIAKKKGLLCAAAVGWGRELQGNDFDWADIGSNQIGLGCHIAGGGSSCRECCRRRIPPWGNN